MILAQTYCAVAAPISSITSAFNGTNIADTSFIWFNSHLTSVSNGIGTKIIYFRNQKITFTSPQTSIAYTLPVPDAEVIIDSSTGTATTSFNTGSSTWQTQVANGGNNPFLAGLSWDVPTGEDPNFSNPVTWTGEFFANQPFISVNWQWAAAVYTSFSTDYNSLGVTPIVGAGGFSQSGTPANFTAFVTVGARRNAGSNDYTGSNAGTATASNLSVIPEPSSAILVISAVGLFWVRALGRKSR
jgi:hypothetical protein